MQPLNPSSPFFKPIFFKVLIGLIWYLTLGTVSISLASGSAIKKLTPHQPLKVTAKAKTPVQPSSGTSLMQSLAPKGIYVVVDTAQNTVYVREGNKILHTAVASTGSGASLKDPRDPNKGWVFETPRGVYAILNKIKNPAWVKPDWAFIEEGEAIPTKSQDRIETGVLGDYALGFGNGYFIHGTLYTRMLGTNVTHGCIRLGDEDLEYLYRHVPTGATLIIY
ncbi:MAG: L,D-transpeptidase [Nitrospirales bacterium]|nr:L,D-transpeptidase [Nitrospirales bacterium]